VAIRDLLVREQGVEAAQVHRLDAYLGNHRTWHAHAQCLLDCRRSDRLALVHLAAQGFLHRDLAVPRRQVQDPQILLVCCSWVAGQQGVIRQPEDARREQLLAVAVLGKRPRLAHQPVDDVPVVDALLVSATQPRQHLDPLLRVPDLQVLHEQSHLNTLADQPAGHRVTVPPDVDQAPLIDLHLQSLARLQPPRRQRPQHRLFLRQPRPPARVELPQELTQELRVRLPVDEVATASQHQRLVHSLLEPPVPLLDVAVLVGLSRLNLLPRQPVVPQQRLVALRKLLAIRQVVDRRAQPVGAMPPRHAPQLPQGVLQALTEALQTLREADRRRLPIGVGEHEVVH
jgi:hypothetical protein